MKILVMSFFSDEIGILSVNCNNVDLDDGNFDEDDPETIIRVRLMAWYNKRNVKHLEKV